MTKKPGCVDCGACDGEEKPLVIALLHREEEDGTYVHAVGVSDPNTGMEIVFTCGSKKVASVLQKKLLECEDIQFDFHMPEDIEAFLSAQPPVDKDKLN